MGQLQRVEKLEGGGIRYPVVQYSDDYSALGQVGTVTYGNGAKTTHTYWPGNYSRGSSRLHYLNTTDRDGKGIQNLEYTYDDLGNVDTVTDSVNGTQYDFVYDEVSRLTRASASCPFSV